MKKLLSRVKNFLADLVKDYLTVTQRLSGCHI